MAVDSVAELVEDTAADSVVELVEDAVVVERAAEGLELRRKEFYSVSHA